MCDPKNRSERVVVLGPTATPKSLRGLRRSSASARANYRPLFRSNRGTRLSYDVLHYGPGLRRLRPRRDAGKLRSTQGYAELAEVQLRAALEQA